MSTPAAPTRSGTFRRLARIARPQSRRIAGLYGLGLAATPLALLTPLSLKIAVDSGLGDDPLPGLLESLVPGTAAPGTSAVLLVAAALFVVVALLSQLQQLASAALGAVVGERLLLELRAQLFRHAQRLSLAYHDERGAAESTYRIQYDAMSIQWIVTNGLAPLVTSLLTVVAMIYVTALIDLQLVFVALCVTPVLLGLTHLYRRRLKAGWHEAKALESSSVSIVQEVLGGLRVVKAFGQEDREEERFVRTSSEGMRARVRMSVVEGVFALLIGVTTAVGTAAVLYIGARHVQSGTITLGELLLIMGYMSQLYSPLQNISRTFGRLQAAIASAERVFAVLDEAPDVEEAPNPQPLERARGAVKFRDVGFGYGERSVFRDVTFGVPAGRVRGGRRRHGRRQDHADQPADAVLRPDGGPRDLGRGRRARVLRRRPAQPVRARPAGAGPLLYHRAREHRLRPARGEHGRDRRGGAGRQRTRVHLQDGAGLRHPPG